MGAVILNTPSLENTDLIILICMSAGKSTLLVNSRLDVDLPILSSWLAKENKIEDCSYNLNT